MIIDNPIVSGSLNVQNNVTASNGLITNDLTVLGTINATIEGTSATASYVEFSGVANKPSLLSGSSQIASEISGAFDNVSSSIASRITSQEDFSSSLNATFATDAELDAVSSSLAADIAGISTDFADITNKPTLISSSAQIASDISGSFTSLSSSLSTRLTDDESSISSLNAATSSYLLNTTDTLDGNLTVTGTLTAQDLVVQEVTSSIIFSSGSNRFGNELTNSHNFTGSVNITGSLNINGAEVGTGKLDETVFNSYTSSTDTRLDTLEGKTLLSSSAQIATEISGAFDSVSSSIATDIANISTDFADITNKPTLVSSSAQLAEDISGSFGEPSSSFSTRVTSLESFSSSLDATFATDADLNLVSSSVDSLNAATSSYALKSQISGSITQTSASIASDITDIIDGTTTVASASNAITASYALNAGAGAGFPFSGSAVITGSLYVSGSTISGSFVGDGSQLTGIEIASTNTVTASFAATSSVTINHNFNSKNVSVNVYDNSDILLIPQQVQLVDNNNVKVDFGGTTTGFAVVAKGGHLVSGSVLVPQVSHVSDTFTSSSYTITHGFDTKEVIVSVYENDSLIIPDSVTTPTNDTVKVTFPEEITARIVVVKAGHIISGSLAFDNLINSPLTQGVSEITASKHIIPSDDATYDLGSSSKRWRDIYLATASIYLGDTVITEDNLVTTASLQGSLPGGTLSGSIQIHSEISGAFDSVSSSLSSRIASQESFSSSLDSTFATDAQVSTAVSALNAATSSYLQNTTDTLTGNLTVTGTITAQDLHVQEVTSSIVYSSGSNIFGNQSSDIQQITGSLYTTDGEVGINATTNYFNEKLFVGGLTRTLGLHVAGGIGNSNYGLFSHDDDSLIISTSGSRVNGDGNITLSPYGRVNINNSGDLHVDSGTLSVGTTSAVTDRRFQVTGNNTSLSATGTQFGIVNNPTYPNTITSNIYNLYTGPNVTSGATLTNLYSLYLESNNYAGSTVTNSYALYQAGTSDENYFAGITGFGNSSPYSTAQISINSGTRDYIIYGQSSDANAFISLRDDSSTANIEFGAIGNNHVFLKDSTEYMRIDANGNVGIGTNNPATAKVVIDGDQNYYSLRLNGDTTTGQSYGARFRAGTNGSDKALLVENTSASELLAVRGDGIVTIPGELLIGSYLNIQHASHAFIDNSVGTTYLRNTATGGSGFIFRNSNIGDIQFDNEFAGNIVFNTSNIERMRIASDGKVTITGDTNSTAHLKFATVSGGSTNSYIGNFAGALYLSTNYYYDGGHNSDTASRPSMEYFMGDDLVKIATMPAGSPGSRTTVLAISGSAGNVGIGTDAPNAKLQVADGNNNAYIGDLQGNSTMVLRMHDNASYPIEVQAYGTELRFNTSTTSGATPSVKMNITSAGNVGINTTSPDHKLNVNGGTQNVVAHFQSEDGTGGIKLSDSTGNVELTTSGTHGFNIQPNGGSTHFRLESDGDTIVGGDSSHRLNAGKLLVKDTGATNNSGIVFQSSNNATHWRCIVNHNTTSNTAPYWHIKTNVGINSNTMFLARMWGYNYSNSHVIDILRTGYAYSGTSSIIATTSQNNGSNSADTLDCYVSSDSYLCFRGYFGGSYYLGVWFDFSVQNPAGRGHNLEILAHALNNTSGTTY